MEVRVVDALVSVLRPGQLRRRMRHASTGVIVLTVVWIRSVLVADRARVVRSQQRMQRSKRIHASLELRRARVAEAIAQQQLQQDAAGQRDA